MMRPGTAEAGGGGRSARFGRPGQARAWLGSALALARSVLARSVLAPARSVLAPARP
jgi:hypothetical protein